MNNYKLSPRLQALHSTLTQAINIMHNHQALNDKYTAISVWDCCCDHGYLGKELLHYDAKSTGTSLNIHFVDQVPSITAQLKASLPTQTLQPYKVHTLDARALKLSSNGPNIVVLAGVGGEMVIELIEAISNNNAHISADDIFFAVCPNYYSYELRDFLRTRKFALICEQCIVDRKIGYEIMLVNAGHNITSKEVSALGDFWSQNNSAHLSYLNSRIAHYKRKKLATGIAGLEAEQLAQRYQQLKDQIFKPLNV